jgi:hypothetical protein
MADLLVHVASGFAVGRPLRDGRLRSLLYLGVCLPDLLYKGLLYLGNAPTWLCEPTHSPLGQIPFCYAAALLFEEAWRKRAFLALLGGGWLHLLLDLGKSYMGSGVIAWAFPFSMGTVELGWYYPEQSVAMMLPSIGVILAVELVCRALRGRRPASPGGGASRSPSC